MPAAERPPDEERRLATLWSSGLLDSPPEERFDRLTRLAQRLLDVPVAMVTLIDGDRQWFKSKVGTDLAETPRSVAFCSHAILDAAILHVPDSLEDVRFADNPMVLGEPRIRFYAGCPIEAPDGSRLGTICVIGTEPRTLSESDLGVLRDLGEMVESEIAAAHLAIVDPETRLSNRRGLYVLGDKVFAVCDRQHLPATLVLLEMTGTRLPPVIEVAEILSSSLRRSDVLARVGDSSFGALLTGALRSEVVVRRVSDELARRKSAIAPVDVDEPQPDWALHVRTTRFDPESPLAIAALMRTLESSAPTIIDVSAHD